MGVPKDMTGGMPILCGYGFKDGTRRGLIAVNRDTPAPQPARPEFDGSAADGTARMWVMAGNDVD